MAYKNILNTVDHVDGILAEVGFGKGNDLSDIIGIKHIVFKKIFSIN